MLDFCAADLWIFWTDWIRRPLKKAKCRPRSPRGTILAERSERSNAVINMVSTPVEDSGRWRWISRVQYSFTVLPTNLICLHHVLSFADPNVTIYEHLSDKETAFELSCQSESFPLLVWVKKSFKASQGTGGLLLSGFPGREGLIWPFFTPVDPLFHVSHYVQPKNPWHSALITRKIHFFETRGVGR